MPELEQKNFQKRLIAYKIKISHILNANFEKNEFSVGFIKVNNVNISRVNIIGTIVYKSVQENGASVVIDDNTGKILLRSFDAFNLFSKIDVGDMTLVIGRLRDFNNEKYIVPEILKKTDLEWFNVRKAELNKNEIVVDTKKDNTIVVEKIQNLDDEVYLLIKNLDSGDGVSIEDIISNSKSKDPEIIINKLLESGNVFEIRPGRLKVLE